MKKQKAKKAGAGKKKEDKTESPAGDAQSEDKPADKPEDDANEVVESPAPADDDDEPSDLATARPAHARKMSVAVESRQRSESFYRSGAMTSPPPLTPGTGASSEIYREQAARIEELEKDNKRLETEVDEYQSRWRKGEEELEELREGRGDLAIAVEKGKEADRLVCGLVLELQGLLDGMVWYGMLTRSVEVGSRGAYATAITAPNSKCQSYTEDFDGFAQPVCLHRRSKRTG